MMQHCKRFLRDRSSRARGVTALALFFLLVGVFVSVDVRGTRRSEAQVREASTQDITAPSTTAPKSFVDLVKALSPTVVNIRVTTVTKARGRVWQQQPEGPFRDFFEHFFRERQGAPEQFRQQGAGSGVIISADGYILTNNHVVENAEEVTVTLADKEEYSAEVVGRDAKTDLAVLKVSAKEALPTATLGDSEALQVGDWVLAIGNPFGLGHTVTSGIVSAKGRIIGAGPYDDFIQTDASINPGNSGGPLFNMAGDVVGINTAILPHGHGIGFAIPSNTAKPLIPQLVSTGAVTRGYFGVGIQSVTPDLVKALNLPDRKGALVSDIEPDSPAAQAALQRGDVIVGLNDEAVDSAHDLPAMAARLPVGKTVSVTVIRNGKKRQIPITVGKFPDEEAKAEVADKPESGEWGLQLQNISPEMAQRHGLDETHGVLVADVQPDSPAAESGVRRGDIILEVNRQPVHTISEIKDVLAQADDDATLLLLLQRRQEHRFVALAK